VNTYGFGGAPPAPALPAFATVTEIKSAASSNYNGLQLSVKNQSKYVTLNFNYITVMPSTRSQMAASAGRL
jgi:hypothetical protein